MIKESCNLIGQEHILVNHLKASVIHDKEMLFSLRLQLIFRSALLLLWQYQTQTNQI